MTAEAAATLILIGLLIGFGLGTAFGAWLKREEPRPPLEIYRVDGVTQEPRHNDISTSRNFTRETNR